MPKKDPVRGMEPMSEYTRVTGSDLGPSRMDKALDVAGSALVLAGVGSLPLYAAKRMSDAKKKTDEQEKRQKSGMELEIENAKKDRRVKEEQEAYDKYDKTRLKDQGGMKKGGRVGSARASGPVKKKRYAEGGEIAAQQPTYPFYGNQPAASTTQPAEGVSQTFNIQPGMSSADMGFKKGGQVRTASQRADGCAVRGKTRAR